jgi:hypothetical protein
LRIINERTAFKLLIEGNGVLVSVTTKSRAYFFFLTGRFLGARTAPTTDPYPGIVELCGYDIARILRNWNKLANVRGRSP